MSSATTGIGNNRGLPLPGLDGSNPLGFLAALGVFRSLAEKCGHGRIRMKWIRSSGTLIPEICGDSGITTESGLLDSLDQFLAQKIDAHPVRVLEQLNNSAQEEERRAILIDSVANSDRRASTLLSWLAALTSEFAAREANNQLQTARRDYYYDNLMSVIASTKREHLRRSLFCGWDYADALDNQSLHLDPSEDRRHAYQWNRPSGDPNRKKSGGMLGANRLAIEAIPLFASLPEQGSLRTVGFSGNRSTDTRWTWPLWETDAKIDVIWSVLLAPELQARELTARHISCLREKGVSAVYRTYRILVGKTPNFTPATRIA